LISAVIFPTGSDTRRSRLSGNVMMGRAMSRDVSN
jgi:hypothetical protein